jgi:hypothetical protein
MKCPICKGYIWTESDRALLGSWKNHIRQHGVDIVCIAGHRISLTSADYRKYMKEKKRIEEGRVKYYKMINKVVYL